MANVLAPEILPAYSTENTTVNAYTFWTALQYDSAITSPSTCGVEVQIDNQTNFASPNLMHFVANDTSSKVINFQNGDFVKAWEVKMPWRQRSRSEGDTGTQTWYYRFRVNDSSNTSPWTGYQVLTIKPDYFYTNLDDMMTQLSDEHTYSKESYSSNVASLWKAFAKEYDKLKLEYLQTQDDNYIDSIRDSKLAKSFGAWAGIEKESGETATQYRYKVRKIVKAHIKYSGVEQGIRDVVKAYTAVDPLIIDNSANYGWILGRHYLKDPDYPALLPNCILYSRITKGFGFTIHIYNHWGFSLDTNVLEPQIKAIMPAHVKVTFVYP